jgi:hypothetical protein
MEDSKIVIPMGDYMQQYANIYSELMEEKKKNAKMWESIRRHNEIIGETCIGKNGYIEGSDVYQIEMTIEKMPISVEVIDTYIKTSESGRKYPSKRIVFNYEQ